MSQKKNGLISSYKDRMERGYYVRLKLLEFLRDETYTSIDIVCELCGYSTKRGAEMMLAKMENEGYIKSIRRNLYSAHGQKVYGITNAGYSFCTPDDEMPDNPKIFLPYRLNLNQFDHKIKTQKLRVALSNINHEIGDINGYPFDAKRPDLIVVKMTDDDGEISDTETVTSYEIELTIKSITRYKKIILDYEMTNFRFDKNQSEFLEGYKKLKLYRVVWVTESDQVKEKLEGIFKRLISIYNEKRSIDVQHVFISFDVLMDVIQKAKEDS